MINFYSNAFRVKACQTIGDIFMFTTMSTSGGVKLSGLG